MVCSRPLQAVKQHKNAGKAETSESVHEFMFTEGTSMLDSGLRDKRELTRPGIRLLEKWRNSVLSWNKIFIAIILSLVILGSATLNRLTLASIIGKSSSIILHFNSSSNYQSTPKDRHVAVTLYWYLQFTLLMPDFITFLWCLVVQVLRKTTVTFPRLITMEAVIIGVTGSIAEVFAMTTFVYLILSNVSSELGLILLSEIIFAQIAMEANNNLVSFFASYFQKYFSLLIGQRQKSSILEGCQQRKSQISITKQSMSLKSVATFKSKMTKVLSVILQLISILSFIAVWSKIYGEFDYESLTCRLMIGYSAVVVILSIAMTNTFHEYVAEHKKFKDNDEITSGEQTGSDTVHVLPNSVLEAKNFKQSEADDFPIAWCKSSFICSGIRLILYPFISYIVFRFVSGHHIEIDPWCLHHSCEITLNVEELPVLIIKMTFMLSGYIIGWVACCMMQSKVSLFAPLIVSTPSAVTLYYLFSYVLEVNLKAFLDFSSPDLNYYWNRDQDNHFLCFVWLWLCQLMVLLYFYFNKSNVVPSRGSEMLLAAHHDGVVFEKQFMLNREAKKYSVVSDMV